MSNETPNPIPEPNQQGGLGGVAPVPAGATVDPRTPGKDLKLIKAAVNRRWNIRDGAMQHLPDSMLKIALDPGMDPRARVSAASVVVKMNGQNIDQDEHEDDQARPAPGVNVQVNTQVNVGINMEQVRQELLTKRPDLIDERRKVEVVRAGVEHKQSAQDRVVELPAAVK